MLISCTSSLLSGTPTVLDNAVAAPPMTKTVLSFILTRSRMGIKHMMAFWSQRRRYARRRQESGAENPHPRTQACFEVYLSPSSLCLSSVNVLDPLAVEHLVTCLGKSSRMFRSAPRAPAHASEERFMVGPVVE